MSNGFSWELSSNQTVQRRDVRHHDALTLKPPKKTNVRPLLDCATRSTLKINSELKNCKTHVGRIHFRIIILDCIRSVVVNLWSLPDDNKQLKSMALFLQNVPWSHCKILYPISIQHTHTCMRLFFLVGEVVVKSPDSTLVTKCNALYFIWTHPASPFSVPCGKSHTLKTWHFCCLSLRTSSVCLSWFSASKKNKSWND